jgi:hypothetical protein
LHLRTAQRDRCSNINIALDDRDLDDAQGLLTRI